MTELPKFHGCCPCVDMYYGPSRSALVLSARRWTSDGKLTTPDGTFLFERTDCVLALPVEPIDLGSSVRKALTASRQFGKLVPALPQSVRDRFNLAPDDELCRAFVPTIIWTHRDTTTPYVVGAARSEKVQVDLFTIPKDSSDDFLGRTLLEFFARIDQLVSA